MANGKEAVTGIGPKPEELRPEALTPIIKDRINTILDIVKATPEEKEEGLEVICTFSDTGDIKAGSMGVYYGGDENYESLEFYRFYGVPNPENEELFLEGTGRDACHRFSLFWSDKELKQGYRNREINYSEWDELKPKDELVAPQTNTRKAVDLIDALIGQFEIVVEAESNNPNP